MSGAFTCARLREVLATHTDLAKKLEELEKTVAARDTKTYACFREAFYAMRALMVPPEPQKRPIGFLTPEKKKRG